MPDATANAITGTLVCHKKFSNCCDVLFGCRDRFSGCRDGFSGCRDGFSGEHKLLS